MIFGRIENREGGFDVFNAEIAAVLRVWLLAMAKQFLLKGDGNFDLQIGVATLEKELGYLDNAMACYQQCLRIACKEFGADSLQVAKTHVGIASVHETQGCLEKALEEYKKSMIVYERHCIEGEVKSGEVVRTKLLIAGLYLQQDNHRMAVAAYTEAFLNQQKIEDITDGLINAPFLMNMASKLYDIACDFFKSQIDFNASR